MDRCLYSLSVLSVMLVYCGNVGVLWPHGWMDQDETWHGDRPRPRPHCVRWRSSSSLPKRKMGIDPRPSALLWWCLLEGRGCPVRERRILALTRSTRSNSYLLLLFCILSISIGLPYPGNLLPGYPINQLLARVLHFSNVSIKIGMGQKLHDWCKQELIRRWDSERELLRSAPRKLPEFAEITQNNGHYAVQSHSRSPILVPIKSSVIYDFLLVLNSNLPPVLPVSDI